MIADGGGRAIALRLAPGQAHELPQAVPLLDALPGVPRWVVADRDFLAWRDRMRANIEVWRGKPEDRGTLLSGGPLDDG